jgi:hypothetical protein
MGRDARLHARVVVAGDRTDLVGPVPPRRPAGVPGCRAGARAWYDTAVQRRGQDAPPAWRLARAGRSRQRVDTPAQRPRRMGLGHAHRRHRAAPGSAPLAGSGRAVERLVLADRCRTPHLRARHRTPRGTRPHGVGRARAPPRRNALDLATRWQRQLGRIPRDARSPRELPGCGLRREAARGRDPLVRDRGPAPPRRRRQLSRLRRRRPRRHGATPRHRRPAREPVTDRRAVRRHSGAGGDEGHRVPLRAHEPRLCRPVRGVGRADRRQVGR